MTAKYKTAHQLQVPDAKLLDISLLDLAFAEVEILPEVNRVLGLRGDRRDYKQPEKNKRKSGGGKHRFFLLLRSAMLIKSLGKFVGDLGSVAAFYLTSLEHVNELAVFQDRDRRRRRSVAGKVTARSVGGFAISTRKHGRDFVRPDRVLQSERHAGSRLSRSTAAN